MRAKVRVLGRFIRILKPEYHPDPATHFDSRHFIETPGAQEARTGLGGPPIWKEFVVSGAARSSVVRASSAKETHYSHEWAGAVVPLAFFGGENPREASYGPLNNPQRQGAVSRKAATFADTNIALGCPGTSAL